MYATITTKGQVTIPKKIRDALNINPHDKLDFEQAGDRIVMTPVKTLKAFRGAVKTAARTSASDQRAAAKAAVGKRVKEEMG